MAFAFVASAFVARLCGISSAFVASFFFCVIQDSHLVPRKLDYVVHRAHHTTRATSASAASLHCVDTVTRGAVSGAFRRQRHRRFGPNLEAGHHPASELSSAPESPRAALHARGLADSPARSPAEFRRSEAPQHLGINQHLQKSVVCGLFYHIF